MPVLYNAAGAMITPMLARRVMADAFAARFSAGGWRMRIEQKIAAENCAVNIEVIKGSKVPDLADLPPMTFCGVPVAIDEKIPSDEIHLSDKSGLVIAKIINLAVPK